VKLRWISIAAPLVLSGLVVSMAASPMNGEVATRAFRPPPSTTGMALPGGQVSLGSMRGAPLVVIFFASWCGPCHTDARAYAEVADRYRQRVGFISVAVDDPPREVRAFARRYDWTWPVVRDDEHRWVAAFGPPGVPATFVLDADGVVVQTLAGPVTEERIHAAVDPLVPSGDTVGSDLLTSRDLSLHEPWWSGLPGYGSGGYP
jgi:cytochrome c biogenesis protein CcmG, thiol:disulfide interchange protein DsbE